MPHEFTVHLEDPQNPYQSFQSELRFRPTSWSWMAVGGPDEAEIAIIGPVGSIHEALKWLGYRIRIRNENGSAVWFGFVNEVEVSFGMITVSLSLDEMYNRVAVNYVYTGVDGVQTQGTTAWQDDSAGQSLYGIKELLLSFEGTATEAANLRNKTLVGTADTTGTRTPKPQIRVEQSDVGATLHCLGPWRRLGWQYYQNLQGLEENTATGSGDQYIGASYTVTTIRFAVQDDIYDSAGLVAGGLDALAIGDRFTVAGAADADNNGEFTVKSKELSGSDGHIETATKDRVTAAAGPSITLSRGGSRVDRIGQSFTLSEDVDDWTVATISVRVQAVGSPGDNLICELKSDSSGSPGGTLDSATIAGSALSGDMTWVEFTLANTQALSYGTTYWIVLQRSGSNTLASYYIVDVDEDATYGGGQVKVYDGSAWATRSPAADMPFRITGKVETTTQLLDMIESNAEFGTGSVILRDASGVDTWQYRAGDSLASDEIDALIELGAGSDARYLADVIPELNGVPDRSVTVYVQPDASESDLRLNADGTVAQTVGGVVAPVEPGISLAGQWLLININQLRDVLGTTALFVERAEYVADDAPPYHIESEGSRRVWSLTRARQG